MVLQSLPQCRLYTQPLTCTLPAEQLRTGVVRRRRSRSQGSARPSERPFGTQTSKAVTPWPVVALCFALEFWKELFLEVGHKLRYINAFNRYLLHEISNVHKEEEKHSEVRAHQCFHQRSALPRLPAVPLWLPASPRRLGPHRGCGITYIPETPPASTHHSSSSRVFTECACFTCALF